MKLTSHKISSPVFAVNIAALLALCACLPARADYSSTVLSQGPVGYWRLNETTPPPLPSIATNLGTLQSGADGDYNGFPTKGVPGALGGADKAVSFDGGFSQWATTGYQPDLNPTNFTIEAWLNPGTDTPAGGLRCALASMHSGSPRAGWLIYQASAGAAFGGSPAGWDFRTYNQHASSVAVNIVAPAANTPGTWYHVVATWDGSVGRIYVNGALGATSGATNFVQNPDAAFSVGVRSDGGFPWSGAADEVAYYTNVLTADDIKAHYDAASTNAVGYAAQIAAANPILYWRLDDRADPVAANAGTLGGAGNGFYSFNATPGQAGPASPAYPGFDAANKAVGFDGGGLTAVSVPALNLNADTVTMTGWIKANGAQSGGASTPGAGLIVCDSASTYAGLVIDQSGGLGLSYVWAGDPGTFSWSPTAEDGFPVLPDGDWAFVALVVDPVKATLYIADRTNYLNFTSDTHFPTAGHAPQAFEGTTLFGYDYNSPNFVGSIDEVAIFDRSLSAGEVYSQYSAAVGGVPPRIFADPQSPPPLFVGDPLNLSVDAGGSPTLTYQWSKDGGPITGATTSTYAKASVGLGDAGSYSVTVANGIGSPAVSQTATVTVGPDTAPDISQNPSSHILYEGGTLNLSVMASGGQLSYQWQRSNTNLPGATASGYIVPSVTTDDAGSYTVIVTNFLGGATSAPPAIITVLTPAAGSYEDAVLSDAPEAWWRLNETSGTTMFDSMGRHDGIYTNVSGNPVTLGAAGVIKGSSDTAVSFDGSASFGTVPYSPSLQSSAFTLECWAKTTQVGATMCPASSRAPSGQGCWVFTSGGQWLMQNGAGSATPGGTVQPDQWSYVVIVSDNSVGLRLYVDGQWDGFGYAQFARNGTAPFLIGAVGGVATPSGVAEMFNGTVDEVAVYNTALPQARLQAHYQAALFGSNTKPIFRTQPQSQLVVAGSAVTLNFSSFVEGSVPISFQWFKDSSPIPGGTSNSLTVALSNAQYSDSASYQLWATNAAGVSNSLPATVTVLAPASWANVTNGLALHLKFDGDYNDSSGRGNNGTPTGTNDVPAITPGKIGSGALHFSTTTISNISGNDVLSSSYVTLGKPADLQFGTSTSFSLSYWIRLTNGALPGDLPVLCSATNSANNFGFTFAPGYKTGGWQWSLTDTNANFDVSGASFSINNGAWHHILHTFDRSASLGTTYLDGLLVDQASIAGLGSIDSGKTNNIGQDPTGLYPEPGGYDIDDLGVWRRALTHLEAFSIYGAGLNGASFDSFDTNCTVRLAVAKSGANLLLIWEAGTLQEADEVTGPWTPVAGAIAPRFAVEPPGAIRKFYRVHP